METDTKMKTVDVIIPLYNGARWIRETLDSALGQSHKPNKIIVVDDGSTDDSKEIVSSYRRADVVLLQNSKKGPSHARNLAVERSDSEFVAFLDQDDLWHPDHLKLLIEALEQYPRAPAAISQFALFQDGAAPVFSLSNRSREVTDPWKTYPSISTLHTTSAILYRSGAVREAGGWSPDHQGNGDYYLFLKVAVENPVVRVKARTFAYRQHPGSFMAQLQDDVLWQILLWARTADDLLDYYLGHKKGKKEELFVRRRNLLYKKMYLMFLSLVKKDYRSLGQAIAEMNASLVNETGTLKLLIQKDIAFVLSCMAENERDWERNIRILLEGIPRNSLVMAKLLSGLMMQRTPKFGFILKHYFKRPWMFQRLIPLLKLFQRNMLLAGGARSQKRRGNSSRHPLIAGVI